MSSPIAVAATSVVNAAVGAALRPAGELADDGADPAAVGHGEEFAGHDSTAAR